MNEVTAWALGAYTGGNPDLVDLGPDDYRAYTNPVFAVPYDISLAGTGDVVMTDLRQTSAALVLGEELDGRFYIRNDKKQLVAELRKSLGRPVSGDRSRRCPPGGLSQDPPLSGPVPLRAPGVLRQVGLPGPAEHHAQPPEEQGTRHRHGSGGYAGRCRIPGPQSRESSMLRCRSEAQRRWRAQATSAGPS